MALRNQSGMPPLELFWPAGPATPYLAAGEVHLWAAPLDPPDEFLRKCETLLSADERDRAARFRTGPLRSRYIAGRGTLRILLGRYLQADPAEVSLVYQSRGKPELGPPWNERGVEFNLSHSGELALFAVTLGRPIGVDIEVVRPMPNAAGLMERFFSKDEIAQWRQAATEQQERIFFQGWTRKEAWLKAVGSGLSFPLDQFCVTMDGPARVLSIRADESEAATWWLQSCEPCRGYVAAVALQGRVSSVREWRFDK
jgi:4'-phosphopantetheinyl transferase